VVHAHPKRLFARWTPLTGFDNPPVFHGRVERAPDGFTVTGTIRETRAVALLPLAVLTTCACGVVTLVLGFTSPQDRTVILILGTFLTILSSVLFVRSLRTRRPRFRQQAGQLEYAYIRTGEVSRPVE
jgi:hypothetical protein